MATSVPSYTTTPRNCQQSDSPATAPADLPQQLRPDKADYGRSKQARRRYRAALDAWHKAARRLSGRPPRSGPPIPGSEHQGRRRYYTLAQARAGGRISGERRRAKAKPVYDKMLRLKLRGWSLRQIGKAVGRCHTTVLRVLRRMLKGGVNLALGGGARTDTPHRPRPRLSPGYGKMLVWGRTLAGLVGYPFLLSTSPPERGCVPGPQHQPSLPLPVPPPDRHVLARRFGLFRTTMRRIVGYSAAMIAGGRGDLEAATRGYVAQMLAEGADSLEAVRRLNGYYSECDPVARQGEL